MKIIARIWRSLRRRQTHCRNEKQYKLIRNVWYLFVLTRTKTLHAQASNVYMYLAYTSAQVLPPLSCSLVSSKSSVYHNRSSWPEDRSREFERPLKTISLESALYPGFLFQYSLLSGSRMAFFEVVMSVVMVLPFPQPHLDRRPLPQPTDPET